MSNHLQSYHSELSEDQRRKVLKDSVTVGPNYIRKDPKQLTLHAFVESSSEDEDVEDIPTHIPKSTAGFPTFDIQKEATLSMFRDFLMSIDGGNRAESTAVGMVKDVSKFLKFASGEGKIQWNRLTDRSILSLYVEKLKAAGLSSSSILNILDSVSHALKFSKIKLAKDSDQLVTIDKMSEVIKAWKSDLRKKKRAESATLVEKQSRNPISFESATDILRCRAVWAFFAHQVEIAESMPEVKQSDLNSAAYLLAHAVGVHGCSRAGAVCNATVAEYREVSSEDVDGVVSWVFRVANHKTSSSSGSAAIVLNDFLKTRIDEYITSIRKRQSDSESESDLLFVLCGNKRLTNLSDKVKRLATRFGFSSINLTGVRKSAATQAAFDSPDVRAKVAHTLGHSLQVENMHYALVKSDQVAAETIQLLHKQPARIQDSEQSTSRKGQPVQSQVAIVQEAASEPKPKQPKRRYTSQQSLRIASYFSRHIREGNTPSVGECAEFLKKFPMPGREPQSIQDKVKNFIKYE